MFLALTSPLGLKAQFQWLTNGQTITITKYTGAGGSVTIPGSITGLPVTTIGNGAFGNCFNVSSVSIPGTVTSIGDSAFSGCSRLGSVSMPDTVSYIGQKAFFDCQSLTNAALPLSLTYLGPNAFFDCGLTSIAIPKGVTVIEDWTFTECLNLTNAELPANLARIGGRAFSGTSLTELALPSGLGEIGPFAFFGTSLTNVSIPASVTSIGVNAFTQNSFLTAFKVDSLNAVYSSADGVLFDKDQVRLIAYPNGREGAYAVPEGVSSIESFAFSSCPRLTLVTIPAGVTAIGNVQSFSYCGALMAIEVDPLNSCYCSADGVLFDKGQARLIQCPGAKAGNYVVPVSVNTIESYAFSGGNLSEVTIPEGVSVIGRYAFSSCASLSRITMADTVTTIGAYAFSWCPRLAKVSLPNSLTRLEDYLFSGCAKLSEVAVPGGVTSIGESAFASCTSLTNLMLPSGVDNIGRQAFVSCTNMLALFCQGNAPTTPAYDSWSRADRLIVYYLPGTTGWGTTLAGRPATLWNPILDAAARFPSDETTPFRLTVTGTTGIPIVLEASEELTARTWVPLQSCRLTNGSVSFVDPASTSYPARFYRVRSP